MHSAHNFNLRGLSPEVMALLKQTAKEQQVSINSLIIAYIEQGIGFRQTTKKHIYHDLDHLAGTWTEKESREFEQRIKDFEKIDEEMWS